MSIVPNYQLKASESFDIKTFGVPMDILTATERIDMWTRYQGYWKSCVVRNRQPLDVMQVRTAPAGPQTRVNPNSELPFQGWGSFFEVTTAAAIPLGVVDFSVSLLKDAIIVA